MTKVEQQLADSILERLAKGDVYTTPAGVAVQGQAVSFLKASLGSCWHKNCGFDGVKFTGLGTLSAFESTCRELGFTVVRARNSRGQLATVVTL